MRQFKEDVQIVIDTVRSPIYVSDSVSFHQKVFSEFETFLCDCQIEYSERSIKEWLQKQHIPDKQLFHRYSGCVQRLIDVIKTGKVSRTHIQSERLEISSEHRQLLDDFIEWVREKISPGSINTYRWASMLFIRFAQSEKVNIKTGCSIRLFEGFIDFLKASNIPISQVVPCVNNFTEYLETREMLDKDLHWFFHDQLRVKRLDEYSDSFISSFDHFRNMDSSLSLTEYLEAVASVRKYLDDNEYMSAVVNASERTFRLLYHFLSRSDLPYTPELADAWVYENKDVFLGAWYMARRALDILAAIATNSDVSQRKAQKTRYVIPGWAYDQYNRFIQKIVKERFRESTINMFRVCIKRFLCYLDENGIHSYEEITPIIIHSFNRDDKHDTNYSKNAYNSRIRRFLEYLEINGIISQPGLHYSLAKTNADGERIVDVLSSSEIETIEEFCRNAETPKELRDAAILQLSLRMGLRSSDVINLEFDNIDWIQRTIQFTQVKTGKEVCLPMPVSVGNAIYAYLSKGRPDNTQTPKLFVSTQKPFGSLSGEVLRATVRNALPNRNVPKSGFHVLRRTFSSRTMNAGNSPEMVAELLGHSGIDNVHKYASMDAGHMRLCSLSFEEAGIVEISYDHY